MLWEAAERRIYVLFDSGSPRWTVITGTWQDGETICQIEPVKIYDSDGTTGNPDGSGHSIPFRLEP
jgi:hypothetical protein